MPLQWQAVEQDAKTPGRQDARRPRRQDARTKKSSAAALKDDIIGDMKIHLLPILLVLSASLSPAFAGSQFNLINGGGVVACLDPDEHFAPVLFDSSWNRCRTFGGWTTEPLIPDGGLVQHFSIVDRDDRPILDGSLCVTLALEPTETPARRFTWTLTAKQTFSGRPL